MEKRKKLADVWVQACFHPQDVKCFVFLAFGLWLEYNWFPVYIYTRNNKTNKSVFSPRAKVILMIAQETTGLTMSVSASPLAWATLLTFLSNTSSIGCQMSAYSWDLQETGLSRTRYHVRWKFDDESVLTRWTTEMGSICCEWSIVVAIKDNDRSFVHLWTCSAYAHTISANVSLPLQGILWRRESLSITTTLTSSRTNCPPPWIAFVTRASAKCALLDAVYDHYWTSLSLEIRSHVTNLFKASVLV